MAKKLRVFKDFRGGLSEVANDNMPDNTLIMAKNCVPGDYAGLARAGGSDIAYPQITDGKPVVWLFEFQPLNSDTMLIAFTQKDDTHQNMYKLENGDEAWTLVSAAAGELNVLDYFVYAGKLYWLNGTKMRVYDGSDIADATENTKDGASNLWDRIEKAVAVEQRGTRWFYATKNNEVIFSHVGAPTAFTSTSLINVGRRESTGDAINALLEFNNGILIFLTRSVYFLSGWDFSGGSDVELSKLSVSTGCIWPKTIRTVENAVLYMGIDGLYRLHLPYYLGQIVSDNISEKKISKRLTSVEPIDMYAETFGGIYYLAVRYKNKQNETKIDEYRYYISEKAFWGEFTQAPWCYYRGSGALYLGCANGYVLKYDDTSNHYINTSTGGDDAIVFTVQTKGYDVAGAMFMDSKLKRAFVAVKQYVAESTTLKLQIKADYADAANNLTVNEINFDESLVWYVNDMEEREGMFDKALWGWQDTVTKEIPVNKKAKRLQYLFHDENTGLPAIIYGVGVLYKRKKVKGNREGVTVADIMYNETDD